MYIYLSEISNGAARFVFPSMPERVQVKNSTNYQIINIIDKGECKIPRGMDTGVISWSGVFFGESKMHEPIVKQWNSPTECKKILEGWQEQGTVLRLLITETNINYDVTISQFSYEDYGGHGNAEYSISFCRHKSLKIYTTDELEIVKFEKKVVTRPEPAPPPAQTYTVSSGDTLWGIAQNFYGNGAQWQDIYNANADTIESTAQEHGFGSSDNGHWIWSGEVLVIP